MSFLNNTRKSGAENENRKSAKLPKLTIQQQIDNNQIIERMNRKITFTKNQRHLAKTIPFVQAFDSSSARNGSVFRVDPDELVFTDFEVGKLYQSQVKLVNKSKHIQRIKITPLQRKQFVVSNVKYPMEGSGDIAPGMQVSIFVRFKPQNLHDNEDELLVIVGDGVIRIAIKAQRQKCMGEWPREINCGHCWVGDEQQKQVFIANRGGEAVFTLEGCASNEKVIGAFKVCPTELKLLKSKNNKINVSFLPKSQGIFQQTITYVSNQGDNDRVTITLKGGAYAAEITLNQINNQRVSIKKFHNCLYLNSCEPGKLSTGTFKVQNHAVVAVDYLWYYTSEASFNIQQQRGKISASQTAQFTVSYRPSDRQPRNIFAYLYLHGLPKQSILNNCTTKIINGVEMIECLQLEVKTTPKNSNMDVYPMHRVISDKIYKGRAKRSSFFVKNNSNVERKFWVSKVKSDQFCLSQCQGYQPTIIQANEVMQIFFDFTITELTKLPQKAYYLIHFDNYPAKMISIQGKVEHPDLLLYSSDVDFGLLRTQSKYRRKFTIKNPGQNQVLFKFANPNRYYKLDFYQFYQFEDEQFFQDKLKIISEGQQCNEWISIPGLSEKTVEFQLITQGPETVDDQVQLLIQNGSKYTIRVGAEVQHTEGKLSQNYVPIKQIFQGNTYNSNKLLPRQLYIENLSNINFRYEITHQVLQQCVVVVGEPSGTLAGKARKKIDLTFEPLKTGPFCPEFVVKFYDDVPLYPVSYDLNNQVVECVPENRKALLGTELLKIQGRIRGVETAYYIKDQSRAKKIIQKITDDAHMSVRLSSYSKSSAARSHYLQNYKLVYPALEELNFYNCEINKVHQLEIIIENNSELLADYEVYAEDYRSLEKNLNQTKTSMKSMMMQSEQLAFTSQMGKTYIQNRALNQAQKVYLSNNKGISILCEPSVGVLNKKQSQKIVITMFNDTSGRFKDNLVISIKDHEVKKFPINIQIKGTPVSLSRNQLGINFNNEVPLLHAGSFLTKSGRATRNIKILNNGPKEVELKWTVYPYGQAGSQQDLFKITLEPAEPGTNNLVETKWTAIRPKPLLSSPFSVTPGQKVVKGREEINFVLNIEQSRDQQLMKALIIGEPVMIEDKSRVNMEDLALIVEAEFVDPKLRIDQQHQNHIHKFERYAIVGNEQRTKANEYHQTIRLKNYQKCNVGFSVSVQSAKNGESYFEIVETRTDSPLQKLKPKNITNALSKTKALNTAPVERQFTLPYQCYVQVGIEFKANPKNTQEWPLVGETRRQGNLIFNFENGDRQVVSLVGMLYRPSLYIEMPNSLAYSVDNMLIDFGTVHVNNYRKKSLYLANPTRSAADWSITDAKYLQTKKIIFQKQLWTDLDREDESITDEKKVFLLSQDSGHLLAQSIPIHYMPGTLALAHNDDNHAQTHKPFRLDFVFKPEANVLYKSKFVIKVEHGPAYEIVVKGRGTFQQQAQIR